MATSCSGQTRERHVCFDQIDRSEATICPLHPDKIAAFQRRPGLWRARGSAEELVASILSLLSSLFFDLVGRSAIPLDKRLAVQLGRINASSVQVHMALLEIDPPL
jgi:hypothetical protein